MGDKPEKYIAIDVETTGPYPWGFDMLSFGACLVDDISKTFYTELKPVHRKYYYDYFRIGSSQTRIARRFNFEKTGPEKILEEFEKHGTLPELAMAEFANWIYENVNSKGYTPVPVSDPESFDKTFIAYYFDKFASFEDPFTYKGENSGSFIKGTFGRLDYKIPDEDYGEYRQHHALDDAIVDALRIRRFSK